MKTVTGLLLPPLERARRQQRKRRAVLRFLREHIWSTQHILQEVMGLAARQSGHRSLSLLEKEGVIRRHSFQSLAGPITVWGITAHGQALAFELNSEHPVTAYFEPSRVAEQTIRHELDLQRIRLKAEASGWRDWQSGDRLGAVAKGAKRPDAIALNPRGQRVAIELERTMKTTKRYEVVIVNYLRALKSGLVQRVVWISPEPEFSSRLRAIITSIKSVRVSGERVAIDPTRHHQHLYFTHYQLWPEGI